MTVGLARNVKECILQRRCPMSAARSAPDLGWMPADLLFGSVTVAKSLERVAHRFGIFGIGHRQQISVEIGF